jgi:5-amino-6-(5-phosphoribosylamino)uracil reductase
MVEGGGTVHTQFLTSGLVDELQLAVRPVFVGDPDAPRFVYSGQVRSADDARLGDTDRRSGPAAVPDRHRGGGLAVAARGDRTGRAVPTVPDGVQRGAP